MTWCGARWRIPPACQLPTYHFVPNYHLNKLVVGGFAGGETARKASIFPYLSRRDVPILAPVYMISIEEWQERDTQDILQLDENVQRWPGRILEGITESVANDAGLVSI
jgi:hypothetical protein